MAPTFPALTAWPEQRRGVLHVDMDAFFAAIEQRDEPSLRGKPVLVGGTGKRGVVAAASYEARPYGCRSAQPTAEARRLCPRAVVLPARHDHYRDVSRALFAILEETAPVVEPLSVDEAYLADASLADARALRERVRSELELTASVGLAPNKFLAKLASDGEKPDGLTALPAERVRAFLHPLPVERVPGVGPRARQRLRRLGVRTVGELAAIPAATLRARFGTNGDRLHQLARGIDPRPVTPPAAAKQIGCERTFDEDIADRERLRAHIGDFCDRVARRLRANGRLAAGVTVKIRDPGFETVTRTRRFAEPTDVGAELAQAARALHEAWDGGARRPVRLLGVAAELAADDSAQLSLFAEPERDRARRLETAMDEIARRHGPAAIRRGAGSE